MLGFHRGFAALAVVVAPLAIALFYRLFASDAAYGFHILDMEGDFLSGLIAALAILLLLQALPLPPRHSAILTTLWLIRCTVTLGLMLFYESYYAALDAQTYFREGVRLSEPWELFSYGKGTENIIALTALMAVVSESYSYLKVISSALGLIGVYLSYRAAVIALGRESEVMLYVLGLTPSILFWTSILGKEPVVALGVGLICIGAVGYFERRRPGYLLTLGTGLIIVGSIRLWLLMIFLAPFVGAIGLSSRSPPWAKVAMGLLVVPVFLLTVQVFADRFSIETSQDLLMRTNEIAAGFSQGNSARTLESGFGSLGGMIAFLPVGIFTALFRPLPGEVMNPFGLLAGIENAAILGMLIYGCWRRGARPFLIEPVLIWAVLTLLAWAAVYGFVSYHNLGTAFRFRQMVSPILVSLAIWAALGPAWRPPWERRQP
ncbi:MAG: hypothetical protein AAGC57_02305 [Pseudomonadota bacterium]